MSRKQFWAIIFGFSLVLIALGVSLYWTVQHLNECSARGQALYKIGLRDGEIFARNQILRAEIERELIEEQQRNLSREKL